MQKEPVNPFVTPKSSSANFAATHSNKPTIQDQRQANDFQKELKELRMIYYNEYTKQNEFTLLTNSDKAMISARMKDNCMNEIIKINNEFLSKMLNPNNPNFIQQFFPKSIEELNKLQEIIKTLGELDWEHDQNSPIKDRLARLEEGKFDGLKQLVADFKTSSGKNLEDLTSKELLTDLKKTLEEYKTALEDFLDPSYKKNEKAREHIVNMSKANTLPILFIGALVLGIINPPLLALPLVLSLYVAGDKLFNDSKVTTALENFVVKGAEVFSRIPKEFAKEDALQKHLMDKIVDFNKEFPAKDKSRLSKVSDMISAIFTKIFPTPAKQ